MSQDVKLFNRGKRTVYGRRSDEIDPETKKGKDYAFKPETSMAFCRADADKLRALYPKEILNIDDVKREFDDKTKDEEKKSATISLEQAEKEKKEAIAEAVKLAVAQALEANDQKHEAARIAAKVEADEEAAKAAAKKEEAEKGESEKAAAEKKADDDMGAKNTVGKLVAAATGKSGKKAS